MSAAQTGRQTTRGLALGDGYTNLGNNTCGYPRQVYCHFIDENIGRRFWALDEMREEMEHGFQSDHD